MAQSEPMLLYTEINIQSSFGLIEENMELSHIHLAVISKFITQYLIGM